MGLMDMAKKQIKTWLEINEATELGIKLDETLSFEGNAIKNKIWYRGDSNELIQLYDQISKYNDQFKFWASKSSKGLEMRKIHTGIPALIVDMLATVSLSDIGTFEFNNVADKDMWEEIASENKILESLEDVVKKTLYIGDGAYKISYDNTLSEFPIVEFYSGDRIDFEYRRNRLMEIIFKTEYRHDHKKYELHEHYGYGYIKNRLYRKTDMIEIPLESIPQTRSLENVSFGGYAEDEEGNVIRHAGFMFAVPVRFYNSAKWDGRGQSIFDKKIDSFDALDEVWSHWMDAIRLGKTKEYIPESLIPRDPNTGALLKPNPFDRRFIQIGNDMAENGSNKIDVESPAIPHESYMASYVTALDQCLQGLISPSTLGIDNKKLDNAEAQREKEKATLYTRRTITSALEYVLSELAVTVIKANDELHGFADNQNIEATIDFGEYANPSFEAQVETISKAKQNNIISIESAIDELYGDSKTEEWKAEEVQRIKNEMGIFETDEPSVNYDALGLGDFNGTLES